MRRRNFQCRYIGAKTRFPPWLSVAAAIGANALLFYVLALARTKPSSAIPEDSTIMRVIAFDLSSPTDIQPESTKAASDVVRAMAPETSAAAIAPALQPVPSFMPRLSDWALDITPDLPGLALAPPTTPDLRSTALESVPALAAPFSIGRVDRLPSRIAGAPPRYPQWARRTGAEAVVTLRFIVTAEGDVRNIKIHDVAGDERLADEAVNAIATWRFSPASRAGKPVACWCFQKLSFKFSN